MKKRNSYSRFIQRVKDWEQSPGEFEKGKIINLLHQCVENDITSFDCTDFPVDNESRTFGTALSESGLSRDKIQLISNIRVSGNNPDPIPKVDDLLLSLKTDYLDLLLLDYTSQPDDLLEGIRQLTSQGKVVEVGGWHLDQAQLKTYSDIFPIRAVLYDWDSFFTNEMNQGSKKSSSSEDIVQMLQYSPSEKTLTKSQVLEGLASKYEIQPFQLILSWLLQHPSHLPPVISSNYIEDNTTVMETKKAKLTPVDWQKVNHLLA